MWKQSITLSYIYPLLSLSVARIPNQEIVQKMGAMSMNRYSTSTPPSQRKTPSTDTKISDMEKLQIPLSSSEVTSTFSGENQTSSSSYRSSSPSSSKASSPRSNKRGHGPAQRYPKGVLNQFIQWEGGCLLVALYANMIYKLDCWPLFATTK